MSSPPPVREPTERAAGAAFPAGAATAALRARYGRYRAREGRALLDLVPRDGRRHLLAAFRERHADHDGVEVSLDALADFCAELLPLPPLEVWMADFERHRAAHLDRPAATGAGPRSPDGSPVVVAVRHFVHGGAACVGQLHVWPRDDRWEGAIEFHADEGEIHPSPDPATFRGRTGAIFREATVLAVRDRFDGFDDSTLAAFLRSSLP